MTGGASRRDSQPAARPSRPDPRLWFESLERQHHASRLGMWLFIGSEVLLFTGLFGLYVAYRVEYPLMFRLAAEHNNVVIGTVNTAILICSSFTVAWAIHAIRQDRPRVTALSLLATVLLGCLFLSLKGWEYSQHFSEGIFPGHLYRYAELPQSGAKMFFTLYYIMTGLHALHVIGGAIVMLVLLVMTLRGRFSSAHHPLLENSGLYWHLVDVIWIFLWPLLYLAG